MDDQMAAIEWRENGVPMSRRFEDPYFSLDDGLAETRHVFLDGNGLPARFWDGFHVAELGFGTGLNLLCAWQSFRAAGVSGQLRFTSFEAFPMSADEAAQALAAFPELEVLAKPLLAAWSAESFVVETEDLRAQIVIGDAREKVAVMKNLADAWFLDGFSPAKNPELWGEDLMRDVGRQTVTGGTFATYTAAGHVRRALEAAGFEVSRVPGFGRKRHMSVGVKQ